MIQVLPLEGIGEILPGCDLAIEIAEAVERIGDVPSKDDILVITQKVVSKAEGRFADVYSITPSPRALELASLTHKEPQLVELVLRESIEIIRAVPHVLIARHHSGVVLANAGIDRSNLGPRSGETALLLPVDSDASASGLHQALVRRWGEAPGIIISDSFGRPWRMGVVNVALGACGLAALVDHRGRPDRDGRPLEVTQIAFADLVASAAGLAMGEGAEGVPAALVRGLSKQGGDTPASSLVRPVAEDLFR